jgi:hypothetical protein
MTSFAVIKFAERIQNLNDELYAQPTRKNLLIWCIPKNVHVLYRSFLVLVII